MDKFYEIANKTPNIKILYVEDEPFTRELVYSILKKYFKNITVCKDGEEALKEFNKNNYDIVITDINMPKMDGLELSKKIRKKNKEISIIIISAYDNLNNLSKALNIGVDGFLIKPIEMIQLKAVLRRVLSKHQYLIKIKETQNYLKQFEEAINEHTIISKTDKKGIITFVNENFVKTSKYSKEELIGKSHNIIRHPDMPKEIFEKIWDTIKNKKTFRGLIKNKAKDGSSYYVNTIIKPIVDLDGNIMEYLAVREDITEYMNPKKMFLDALKVRDDILVYMRLKNYEDIEEFYPLDMIEKIENKALNYLYNIFNKYYAVKEIFPISNGEVAIFIDKKFLDKDLKINLKTIQQRIKLKTLTITNEIEYDIAIQMSVVCEGDNIYESAKLGLKQLIKENKEFIIANNFAQQHSKKAQENIKTLHLVKKAVTNLKIISYYQGIINNKTKKIDKYESLVRLIDDNEKVLSPFFFLETAKKGNYYHHITKIVLNNSFEMLKHIKEDISINLSFLDIEMDVIRHKIYNLLEENKKYTNRIVFELLEDENTKNFELIKEFISKVKEYNVKIAIDDFGSGYSNYTRILDFQPDILKIDGSLIKNIETNHFSQSIVKSIVTFAKDNNIQTVAEFVENENIANIVTKLGVDYSQGYFYDKPSPIL